MTSAAPEVRSRPARARWLAAAAAGAVIVLTLVPIAKVAALHRSPGWRGPVVAIVFATAIVILLVLTRGMRSVTAWIAVLGGVLTLVGSGLMRPAREVMSGSRAGGHIVSRLDTSWPVLLAGIAIAVAAFLSAHARRRNAADRGRPAALAVLSLALGTAVVALLMPDVVVGQWVTGRPVRRRGRLVLPNPRDASDSAARDAWLAAADHETAAVAAFTNLAIRLRDVGAPRDLIERCRRAADDETRHARQCARLAGCGRSAGPGTTTASMRPSRRPARARSRRIALVRIALESFADGVVNEGFAAARLRRSAATADAETARHLRRMARDEGRHSALGADIVHWCRGESGFVLDAALLATSARLPAARRFPARLRGVDPSMLAAAGLGSPSTSIAAWAETRLHAQRWLARHPSP